MKVINQRLLENYSRDVEFYIYDSLRNDGMREDRLSSMVAIAALAFLSKKPFNQPVTSYIEDMVADETTLAFLKRTKKDFDKQVKEVAEKFDADTLEAAVLLSEPARFTEVDQHSTPRGVSELAISLLDLNSEDTILDLGSGVGSFLTLAAERSGSQNLYGVEINTDSVVIANIRRLILGIPVKVIQGNIISQEHSYLSANKVFSNPPLGMRFTDLEKYVSKNPLLKRYFRDAKRTVSGDWVFALGAYLNMKQPGRTVVLMTNAGTWNKSDEEFRRKLVLEGAVEGIILLPERLFSTTSISLTMMVLSQNNKEMRMVDASEIFTEARRQNLLIAENVKKILHAYSHDTDISRKVTVKEIADQEYILNPRRYVAVGGGIENGVSLGELCLSINRGAMIRSSELDELASTDETPYRYLMLKNIVDGVIETGLPSLTTISDKYRKYCLKDKDLIISKISPFKIAMTEIEDGQLILANGNLYFIELDETKVNPVYVQVFLQSEAGMSQLNRLAKGSAIRSISIQDLKMIQIPYLTRERQDEIAEQYLDLRDELLVLQRQADMVRYKQARLLEGVVR